MSEYVISNGDGYIKVDMDGQCRTTSNLALAEIFTETKANEYISKIINKKTKDKMRIIDITTGQEYYPTVSKNLLDISKNSFPDDTIRTNIKMAKIPNINQELNIDDMILSASDYLNAKSKNAIKDTTTEIPKTKATKKKSKKKTPNKTKSIKKKSKSRKEVKSRKDNNDLRFVNINLPAQKPYIDKWIERVMTQGKDVKEYAIQQKKKCSDYLKDVEFYLCDLEHYIEFMKINAYQGYLASYHLQKIRLLRRQLKDELNIIDLILTEIDVPIIDKKEICDKIREVNKLKYIPRRMGKMFKDGIDNKKLLIKFDTLYKKYKNKGYNVNLSSKG